MAVLGVRPRVGLGRAGRGGQVDLDAVEVPEHAAPLAVDRTVALVGDHQNRSIPTTDFGTPLIIVCKVAIVTRFDVSKFRPGRSTWHG